jgi:L-seryl-tRNA(Ser) seleniumtransferase
MPPQSDTSPLAALPSVDRLLRCGEAEELIAGFGRSAVTASIRRTLSDLRAALSVNGKFEPVTEVSILQRVASHLQHSSQPSLRPVFNLTGTVLHTNLGRAALPEEAIAAVVMAARGPANLEYDLADGRRGDRDNHLEKRLCELTGAEAATVVNNNAAAILLVLNTLALRKEVLVSRGELVEIGGSFRMPEIMARAGCRLREVGTTNRTHRNDYETAIGHRTGLVMKVHTSNYSIEGFTASVPEVELAQLCRDRGLPLVIDLGSGALVDLRRYGLPHEPTPGESLASGADLVTFSGDKLLGGPQAGIILGRADLVAKMKRNPFKRALRVDKMTIAALSAVLRIYSSSGRLSERLPTLRTLTRPVESILGMVERSRDAVAASLSGFATVEVIHCESQIGSGALPVASIPSAGLAIRPFGNKRTGGRTTLERLAAAFRRLPMPVVGRLHEGALILDFRCLEDEAAFLAQIGELNSPDFALYDPIT